MLHSAIKYGATEQLNGEARIMKVNTKTSYNKNTNKKFQVTERLQKKNKKSKKTNKQTKKKQRKINVISE